MRGAAGGEVLVNDDAAAALRRAIGFAGLFGLAGVAAIACTARADPPVADAATARLLVQEARWTARAEGAATIVVPPALGARRHDPSVAAALAEAQRQLHDDRAAAEARRDAVIRQMDEVRADRDLHESQRAVLEVKIDQAHAARAEATSHGDTAAVKAIDERLRSMRVETARSLDDATADSRALNALNARVMALVVADRRRAAQQRDDVRRQLRGG